MLRLMQVLCLLTCMFSVSLPLYAADSNNVSSPVQNGNNERAEYWRAIRGDSGYSAVTSGQEPGSLINDSGQIWRVWRNDVIASAGGWFLAVSWALILCIIIIRGRIRLEAGRSNQKVDRWPLATRINHWIVAVSFIFLAITGLSLLFGRSFLIPLLGKESFVLLAEFSKVSHNFVGPIFSVALITLLVPLIKKNMWNANDWMWFKQGGGFVPGKHPSAEAMNAGEKLLFWFLMSGGFLVITSGLVLDFPIFGQTRDTMQFAHVVHGLFSLALIALISGHIYIALVSEGALEGMVTGKVDVNWAKQHHDLWYEEVSAKK